MKKKSIKLNIIYILKKKQRFTYMCKIRENTENKTMFSEGKIAVASYIHLFVTASVGIEDVLLCDLINALLSPRFPQ